VPKPCRIPGVRAGFTQTVLSGPCLACILICLPSSALAAENTGAPQREEIEAWLDSHAIEADVAQANDAEEGLPTPPRYRGVLIESGIGALGHLGDLQQVSPLSPRFYLRAGYEFTSWVFLFGETDVAFSNTNYAPRPPDQRGYALFGFGAGVRFTLDPLDWLGLFVQGSSGVARVNEDVLATYGYRNATALSPYFGGLLGVQVYLPSPHLRLLIEGGMRNYLEGLDRSASTRTALAWMAGPAIGYAF